MQASLLRIWGILLLALCVASGAISCKAQDDTAKKDKDKKEEKKDKADKGDKKKDKDVKAKDAKDSNKEDFADLFNGKDLTGWEGDPNLWKAVDGEIVGESTAEHPANYNTFLIWRAGTVKDFKLRLKTKITGAGANSGVQYRSKEIPSDQKWRITGYQGEISNKRDLADIGTGFIYHEAGRGELAFLGDFAAYDTSGTRTLIGSLGAAKDLEAAGYYKEADWNDYTIIARGNHIRHFVNGFLVAELIDNDVKSAMREGLLALQLHAGGPMKIEFKDIRLHVYKDDDRKVNDSGSDDWIVAPRAGTR